ARQLVGQGHGRLVVALALLQLQCPSLKRVEWPTGSLAHRGGSQDRAPAVDQQRAQVAVAALGDLPQPPLLARGMLAWHQAQPRRQVPTATESRQVSGAG